MSFSAAANSITLNKKNNSRLLLNHIRGSFLALFYLDINKQTTQIPINITYFDLVKRYNLNIIPLFYIFVFIPFLFWISWSDPKQS